LEFGEIGPPFVDGNDLSIEDCPLDRDIKRIGDDRKAAGPVMTVAGEYPGALVQVDLQPVAIVPYLV
jgi:hypothetical protein